MLTWARRGHAPRTEVRPVARLVSGAPTPEKPPAPHRLRVRPCGPAGASAFPSRTAAGIPAPPPAITPLFSEASPVPVLLTGRVRRRGVPASRPHRDADAGAGRARPAVLPPPGRCAGATARAEPSGARSPGLTAAQALPPRAQGGAPVPGSGCPPKNDSAAPPSRPPPQQAPRAPRGPLSSFSRSLWR